MDERSFLVESRWGGVQKQKQGDVTRQAIFGRRTEKWGAPAGIRLMQSHVSSYDFSLSLSLYANVCVLLSVMQGGPMKISSSEGSGRF